jgi:flagellar hook-associated protein 3 FlgL
MRISQNTTYLSFLRDLQIAEERMASAQSAVSSGKRILKPSDDPGAASDILRLSAEDAEALQFGRNIDTVSARLEAAEGILGGVENMVERVRNLALLSVSHTESADLYLEEVRGLREQILSAANASHQGTYLFSGTLLKTVPFVQAPDTTVSYQGNSTVMSLQVNRSMALQSQIPGDEIFTGAVDIFQTISDLDAAMQAGDFTGINAQIQNLTAFTDVLATMRSRLGSTINVAASLKTELTSSGLARVKQREQVEAVNMAQAISELTHSQTSLQATLAVGARLSQLTLLDYLR